MGEPQLQLAPDLRWTRDRLTAGNFMLRAVGDGPIIPIGIPEPSSATLLLGGLIALATRRRRAS